VLEIEKKMDNDNDPISNTLVSFGLTTQDANSYSTLFKIKGFKTLSSLQPITTPEQLNDIGITLKLHVKNILSGLKQLQPTNGVDNNVIEVTATATTARKANHKPFEDINQKPTWISSESKQNVYTSTITSFKFTPDERLLVVGRYNDVSIYNVKSGKEIRNLPISRSIVTCSSTMLVILAGKTSTTTSELIFWDISPSGEDGNDDGTQFKIVHILSLEGNNYPNPFLYFSPDGSLLIVGMGVNHAMLYHVQRYQPKQLPAVVITLIHQWNEGGDLLHSSFLQFTTTLPPYRVMYPSATTPGILTYWDVETRKKIGTGLPNYGLENGRVVTLWTTIKDHERYVAALYDGTLILRDLTNNQGNVINEIPQAHEGSNIYAMQAAMDVLVTGGDDRTFQIWSCVPKLSFFRRVNVSEQGSIRNMALSTSAKWFACTQYKGDGVIRVWCFG
jgi:WD40 repeat protein